MTLEIAAGPVRSAPLLARPVLRNLAHHWGEDPLIVDLPGKAGELRLGEGRSGPPARWNLHNWAALRRVLVGGDLGFAAGYLAGDWDSPDLAGLLVALAGNYDHLSQRLRGLRLLSLAQAAVHGANRNSRAGSKRNILSHYDLGNTFYGAWLDPSMTYSAALFSGGDETLEQAQRRKYRRMAELAGVTADSHVLEVGCGWGGFAEYAAGELGAKVTAVTLSPAQHRHAQERIFRAELSERVEVRRLDYRDLEGQYDALVSIEMFEAVGEAYWGRCLSTFFDRLKPGGRAALQVITLREDLFADYRRRPDFIQLEVFPGGMLPTPSRLEAEAASAGFEPGREMWQSHAGDYARTLRLWRERFDASWPAISELGFDARFRRLWRYYLAYCEAGFRTGRTDLLQLSLRRP